MRPVEFTPEQIIQAGQDLQSTGRNVTGFALRQKVGGGNPGRLKQVWDERLAGQTVATIEPIDELPVKVADEVAAVAKVLTDHLAALAMELNDKAVTAAERRVHEIVRSAGEQREQAKQELADAEQTVEDLEDKLDDAEAAALEVRGQLTEALEVGQAQAVELATLKERLSRLSLIEQHAAGLARVNAQLATAAAELGQARAAVQEAQGEARERARRIEEQAAEIKALRGQVAAAGAEAARLTTETMRKVIRGPWASAAQPKQPVTNQVETKVAEDAQRSSTPLTEFPSFFVRMAATSYYIQGDIATGKMLDRLYEDSGYQPKLKVRGMTADLIDKAYIEKAVGS